MLQFYFEVTVTQGAHSLIDCACSPSLSLPLSSETTDFPNTNKGV